MYAKGKKFHDSRVDSIDTRLQRVNSHIVDVLNQGKVDSIRQADRVISNPRQRFGKHGLASMTQVSDGPSRLKDKTSLRVASMKEEGTGVRRSVEEENMTEYQKHIKRVKEAFKYMR